MDGGNYKPQVRRKEGEKMTKSSKDLWIEKQTAEIARLKEVAEIKEKAFAAQAEDTKQCQKEIARLQHRVAELEEEIYNAVNLLDGAVCPSPHHRVGVEENDCEWCFHRHTVVSQLKGVEAKSAGVDGE
ncbi:MAG: hypothetical protein KDB79_17040 [Acidobacteria bacterium]|nr:hypothetical protein [Acidobacteriota bacterium]